MQTRDWYALHIPWWLAFSRSRLAGVSAHPPTPPFSLQDEVLDFDVGGDGGEEDDGDELFTSKKDKKAGKAGKKGGEVAGDKAADKAKPKAKGRADQADQDADEDGGGEEGVEEGGERVLGSSKKDPAVRRRELLGSGPKSLSAALTAVVAGAAAALVRSPHGGELVVEVARGGEGGLLAELDAAGVGAVQEALVEDAARSPEEVAEAAGAGIGDDEEEVEAGVAGPAPAAAEHVFLNFFSSRALRRLLLAAAEEEDGSGGAAANFAKQLWERAVKGRCKQWVGTHAEKVLAALLHCGVPEVQAAAAKELKPLVKGPVEEWASKFLSHKDKPHHGPGAAHGKEQQQPAAVTAAPPSTTPAAKGKQQPQTPATAGGKRAAQGQDVGQSGKAKQAKRK